MKKHLFVAIGAAALTLAACSNNNQDSVENADLTQAPAEDLNQLSNDAATDAANAEAAALGTQQQQLEQENAAAAAENIDAPTEDDEQNVSGM